MCDHSVALRHVSPYDCRIDRQMLLDHLEETERHITNGRDLLQRQRAILEERRRDSHDVTQSEALLQVMEELQQKHIDHLDLIRKEFEQLDLPSSGSESEALDNPEK